MITVGGGDRRPFLGAAVVVLRGAHWSRTGRATPCEGPGRLDYGGGAVVPAPGTAACASEVAAGPEMGTVFGVAVAGSVIVASMENSEWAL